MYFIYLSSDSTEKEVRSLFSDFGEVLKVSVDSASNSAEVVFENLLSAKEAKLCYDGVCFGEKPMWIKVCFAHCNQRL